MQDNIENIESTEYLPITILKFMNFISLIIKFIKFKSIISSKSTNVTTVWERNIPIHSLYVTNAMLKLLPVLFTFWFIVLNLFVLVMCCMYWLLASI